MTDDETQEQQFAATVSGLMGRRHTVYAAATITPDGALTTCHGCDTDNDFEIGSIAKAITGLLYADAIDRGEIDGDQRLGELLPLGECPAADIRLAALATHRSGLPRVSPAAQPLQRTFELWRRGTNPYRESLDELIDQTRTIQLGRPRSAYSNLGFQLLGHAVAAAASMSYAELVTNRLTDPLGLVGMYVPQSPAELRPTALSGQNKRGVLREAWTSEALGPAGGIRATIADMVTLATALLDGSAPGINAMNPQEKFGPRSGSARVG